MVTRYTIDQILACKDTHQTSPSMSPVGSGATRKITIPESTSITPILSETNVILRDDVEIREVIRSPIVEHQTKFCDVGHTNSTTDVDTLTATTVTGTTCAGTTPLSTMPIGTSSTRSSEVNEDRNDQSLKERAETEDMISAQDSTVHSILRPVPVRPNERSSRSHQETTSSVNATSAPRPDGLHNSQGHNFNALDVGSSVYSLMLRQYMETQLRGFATSGAFLPLAYPVIDPALPHLVGGVGLPYPLTPRSRRRGGQVRFTGEQTRQLESWFHLHKYITPPQRKTIARELSLQERQVKTWFQNRRAKWRKAEGQNGGDGVPSDSAQSPSTSHEASGDDHTLEKLEDDQETQEELIVDDQPKEANDAFTKTVVLSDPNFIDNEANDVGPNNRAKYLD